MAEQNSIAIKVQADATEARQSMEALNRAVRGVGDAAKRVAKSPRRPPRLRPQRSRARRKPLSLVRRRFSRQNKPTQDHKPAFTGRRWAPRFGGQVRGSVVAAFCHGHAIHGQG
jgi:hypothetical protein